MRVLFLISLVGLFFSPGCAEAQAEDASVDGEAATIDTLDSKSIRVGPEPAWVKSSTLLPVPEDPKGLIFFRRNNLFVHLDENGQHTYQNLRMKLLDSRALDVGNLSLTWNPDSGNPTIHRLLIHRGDETLNVLDNNEFEVIQREQFLELSILNGYLTAVLRIPDLRVGDELEWAFTIPSHDPTLGNKSYGLVALGGALQSGRYKLGVSWEKEQEPSIRLSSDLAKLERRTPQAISLTLDDPEMLSPPQDAPIRYSWQRIIEYSDFESWPEVSRYFSDLFDNASILSSDSEIKKEAKRIARNYPGDLERAKAALELVQQQVRYIYVGLNGGALTPVTADDTWNRRYGDCKGKSALLLALLRELNIEAEAVLVNNSGADDGFDERLPSPGLFDHVVLRAQIDGANYWLDPTMPEVVEPSRQPIVPYRWVLPLSANGKQLESLDTKAHAIPQEMGLTEYDARAGFDEPARKVSTSVRRGVTGLAEYMQYSALTSEQLKTGLRNALIGQGEWDSIEDVSYKYDRSTQASILTITGVGPVDWDDEGNGGYDLTLPGGGFNPPSKRTRSSAEAEDAPFYNAPAYSCYVTTVRLPDRTDLENWGYNSTYKTEIFGRVYYRMMERRDDRTIRMVRASRVEETEITPDRARRDNARIDDFDNSMARIEYGPNKVMNPWGFLHSVPATYEVDWTSPDAPCLPDDILQRNG